MTTSSPTTHDFGYGPILAHRHRNPDGTEGGWVADSATVGEGVYVAATASIGYGASIGYRASIGDGASIGDNTSIGDGASIGYGVAIRANTKWVMAPPQIHLPHTVVHIPRRGFIRSGCVELAFAECTDERIREECEKAKYKAEVIDQYVRAIRWLIQGCESGALYQGEGEE